MLYSDNGVTHNYNAKDKTKSNWSTAYFHSNQQLQLYFY